MFEFYRHQIEDFPRTFTELDNFIEEIAYCDGLTGEEYYKLVKIAIDKMRIN